MPKSFVLELHGEWSEFADDCIGLLATVDSSDEEGRWILADSVPFSPLRAVSASDYL
jgi:hypothetical protein